MNDTDFLNIGTKLRTARNKQKMSLRELAAHADVSASLLSQIENGHTNPSVMTLYSVAQVLDVPVTFFFPGTEMEQEEERTLPNLVTDKTPSELRVANGGRFDNVTVIHDEPVVRPDRRAEIKLMGGVTWQRLTPTEENHIQLLEIQYEPGASSGPAMSRHVGREFGMVLEGELILELGFDRHIMTPGDTIIFDSSTPHRLHNEGPQLLRALWIIMDKVD